MEFLRILRTYIVGVFKIFNLNTGIQFRVELGAEDSVSNAVDFYIAALRSAQKYSILRKLYNMVSMGFLADKVRECLWR